MRILFFLLILPALIKESFAQKVDSNIGLLHGIVRDTAQNYVLKSATVSIYKLEGGEAKLLSYQITNSYGEFRFERLPLAVPLKVQVNNVGYETLEKRVSIGANQVNVDLKTLVLKQRVIQLEDVKILVPPISMNGDTLEFNAAAFKVDTNAVVEDLLRKIPNITVWGDNKITVNGREIKSLLVNGKEFFGGDFKIATQNLAKNAVEKIQVYNTVQNPSNPLDSLLELNIKLKKGKETGYFGKIGVGPGTRDRYESDASINAFNPKIQFALVGAFNNINKIARSISSLTASSTFKGVGTSIEYRPDFSLSGITDQNALGSSFTYNFIEKPTNASRSRLNINYFRQDRDNDNSAVSETVTTASTALEIQDKNISNRLSNSIEHKFESKYEWLKKNQSLTITQSFISSRNGSSNESFRTAYARADSPISESISSNLTDRTNNDFDIALRYQVAENPLKPHNRFKGLIVDYKLGIGNAKSTRTNRTDFTSFISPAANREFNRRYQVTAREVNHQFGAELSKVKALLLGEAYFLGIDFSVGNDLTVNQKDNDNQIGDFEQASTSYVTNRDLTNNVSFHTIDESPRLVLTRSFSDNLTNRFTKSWYLNFTAKQKIIYQNNRSDKDYQNINKMYTRFVPEFSIVHTNHQYGEHYRRVTLNYNTYIRIPMLAQLAPVVDSTNVYNIQNGNLGLRESVTRNLSFGFSHEDQTTVNTLNYDINVGMGIVDDNIVDSIFIGADNRRTYYAVNADGSRFLKFNGGLNKAIKLINDEIMIGLKNSVTVSQNPSYLNNVFTYSNNFNTTTSLTLNYSFKGTLAIEAAHSITTSRTKQRSLGASYSGINMSSVLSSSYNVTKKLNVSSNITFNNSKFNNNSSIDYTIWNASAVYRLFKGNNLEIRFSALDLLHQNNNVINESNINSYTIGTQNVLQNYFMTTVSYYPRRFGKREVKR